MTNNKESKVTTFKAGDKVEFTTDYNNGEIQPGDKATVKSVGSLVALTLTSGKQAGTYTEVFDWRLKLVEAPLTVDGFTVGDKVRIKDNGKHTTGKEWIGVEGIVRGEGFGSNVKLGLTTSPNSYYPVGRNVSIPADKLELIEEPAFKVDDLVTFDEADNQYWQGGKARIVWIDKDRKYGINVELIESPPLNDTYRDKKGRTFFVSADVLKLIEEKPFTFADIQKGDTIRRTKTYKSGAVEIREGVVGIDSSKWFWADADNTFILAYDTDTKAEDVTLELLNRPEPEPVWGGATVLTRQYRGHKHHDTFVKAADGSWTIHYPGSAYTHRISATEELEGYFGDAEVKVLAKA